MLESKLQETKILSKAMDIDLHTDILLIMVFLSRMKLRFELTMVFTAQFLTSCLDNLLSRISFLNKMKLQSHSCA